MTISKFDRYSPVAAVIVTGLAGFLTVQALVECRVRILGNCTVLTPQFHEHAPVSEFSDLVGRMAWSSSYFAFLFAGLAALVFASRVFVDALSERKEEDSKAASEVVLWSALGTAVALVFVLVTIGGFAPAEHFLDGAYGALPAEKALLIPAVVYLAAIVMISLGASACLTMCSRKAESENDLAKLTPKLATQLRRLRGLLLVGAILLVAGVFEVVTLYGWSGTRVLAGGPASHSASETVALDSAAVSAHAARVDAMVSSATVLSGTFFSGVLIAIFLPAFLVTGTYARKLANLKTEKEAGENDGVTKTRPLTEAEKGAWLTSNGLVATVPGQITNIIAVLAPILAAGPGAALLKPLFQ